ncbi:MAG: hypothetical protein A2Z71_00950 [Chloroflexi bacterium RBG_13_50_21]|nr:MAG: hypothetical protein A2Z71_00950 [Chloroflexi bacterium RBG_13_50_21]OGO65202.1 MAG: hypothetical protein A2030_05535 [Chloroflexi bacterium RBG_19FT_COMBO_50_10]
MISLKNRRRIILGCTTLLILLMIAGFVYAISHALDADKPDRILSKMDSPGLVVYGTVRNMSGEGVENVSIYRSYSAYPGVLIATTDANGDYEAEFAEIAGEEMVTVWANGQGLTFEPEQSYWRHYYGYERIRCDFVVSLSTEIFIPMINK